MEEYKCEYDCPFHNGRLEWHHPISTHSEVGLWLYQAHHSLLMGRKRRYDGEGIVDKTVSRMRGEVCLLVADKVKATGLPLTMIDKN
jgi:hypothetical protein